MADERAEHRPLAPVLWLTVAVVAVTPLLGGGILGRTASVALVGATALVALRRSGAERKVLRASEVAIAVVAFTTVLTREYGTADDVLSTVSLALLAGLLLITPLVVVVRLGRRPRITADSVAGLLAAYMQFGVFFSVAYRLVEQISSEAFFVGVDNASTMDFQFFSFVTLTTLGYGNLTPAGEVGQQLAIFEALIGQVFLVAIVGLAVGNLGATIPRRRGSADAD